MAEDAAFTDDVARRRTGGSSTASPRPGAWLATVARNRALDRVRRAARGPPRWR